MLFEGIATGHKSALVIRESGTVNAETYVDEFIDGSGFVSYFNGHRGAHDWTQCMTVHRSKPQYRQSRTRPPRYTFSPTGRWTI
jgi:hypothetical protein